MSPSRRQEKPEDSSSQIPKPEPPALQALPQASRPRKRDTSAKADKKSGSLKLPLSVRGHRIRL
jgi:hypothetical protein